MWKNSKDAHNNEQLINLDQITHIFIGRYSNEDDNVSRVLVRYSTDNECLCLYNGTYIECFKIIEQLSEQLNSSGFDIWGDNDG